MPKIAPLSVAIVAPGGALVFTESQRPTVPSAAASRTLPICQESIRLANSRTVAAGATKIAATSRAPITLRAAVVASAISPSRTTSSQPPAAVGPPTSSKPVASQRRPNTRLPMAIAAVATIARRMSAPLTSSRLPKSSCSTFEPEW